MSRSGKQVGPPRRAGTSIVAGRRSRMPSRSGGHVFTSGRLGHFPNFRVAPTIFPGSEAVSCVAVSGSPQGRKVRSATGDWLSSRGVKRRIWRPEDAPESAGRAGRTGPTAWRVTSRGHTWAEGGGECSASVCAVSLGMFVFAEAVCRLRTERAGERGSLQPCGD